MRRNTNEKKKKEPCSLSFIVVYRCFSPPVLVYSYILAYERRGGGRRKKKGKNRSTDSTQRIYGGTARYTVQWFRNAFRSVVHAILFSVLDGKQNMSIDYGATACKQSAGGLHTTGKIFVRFGPAHVVKSREIYEELIVIISAKRIVNDSPVGESVLKKEILKLELPLGAVASGMRILAAQGRWTRFLRSIDRSSEIDERPRTVRNGRKYLVTKSR